jgi:hypothetical protein
MSELSKTNKSNQSWLCHFVIATFATTSTPLVAALRAARNRQDQAGVTQIPAVVRLGRHDDIPSDLDAACELSKHDC